MEVAGLVVGVVPLAVMALQCYEEAQSFTAKMLKRNSLVRSLRRALNGYSAILNIHIDWLLRSTNAHEQCNERDRRAIFEKPEMPKLVKEFLGDVAAEAFSGAILEIVETLEILLKKIEGFLVSDDKVRRERTQGFGQLRHIRIMRASDKIRR